MRLRKGWSCLGRPSEWRALSLDVDADRIFVLARAVCQERTQRVLFCDVYAVEGLL